MIKIEICERAGDRWYDEKGKEHPKYHAQIKGKPGFWSAGNSIDDAIGNLIRCHSKEFNIEVKFLGKLHR
jgi:hypothetical protein